MSETDAKPKKLVREFRQILVWPIQLMPLREGAQIQEHWEALSQPGTDHPWRELRDEFSCDPTQFQQRHYSEFVTFLPYVRRFLYGEGKGRTDAGVVDSPIRVFRRNDVAALRATFPGAHSVPLTVSIAHVDLCFFYDIDVVILIVEVFADDVTLTQALDLLHRFGRGYPTYWHDDGTGGHCLARTEWLGRDDAVLATSRGHPCSSHSCPKWRLIASKPGWKTTSAKNPVHWACSSRLQSKTVHHSTKLASPSVMGVTRMVQR